MDEMILFAITVIITWVLGIVSKKSKFINNNLIPVQNLLIGIVAAIIEWIITKDFNAAITFSGLIAGGAYDVVHNLNKIIGTEEGVDLDTAEIENVEDSELQTEFNTDEELDLEEE